MYLSKKSIIFMVLVLFVIGLTSTLGANGTEADPLISKSYLDLKLKELRTELQGLKQQIAKKPSNDSVDEGPQTAGRVFKPLRLDPGAKIYFNEGTEFIMRVGEASAIDPTSNGIPNLTTGTSLLDGGKVPKNNLFVSPRDDGRGLVCHIEVWLLVKGDYSVVEP